MTAPGVGFVRDSGRWEKTPPPHRNSSLPLNRTHLVQTTPGNSSRKTGGKFPGLHLRPHGQSAPAIAKRDGHQNEPRHPTHRSARRLPPTNLPNNARAPRRQQPARECLEKPRAWGSPGELPLVPAAPAGKPATHFCSLGRLPGGLFLSPAHLCHQPSCDCGGECRSNPV